jgi:serine/threonine protein kinase
VDSNGFISGARKPYFFPSRAVQAKKYFLQDKIGEGAYGKVYRSIDTQTNKEVSVSVCIMSSVGPHLYNVM